MEIIGSTIKSAWKFHSMNLLPASHIILEQFWTPSSWCFSHLFLPFPTYSPSSYHSVFASLSLSFSCHLYLLSLSLSFPLCLCIFLYPILSISVSYLLSPVSGRGPVHSQVQGSRWPFKFRRLRRGAPQNFRHWKMRQRICWLLKNTKEREK